MKDLPNTDSGLFPKEYMDNPVSKIRVVIDMDIRADDLADLDIHWLRLTASSLKLQMETLPAVKSKNYEI